MRTVAKGQSTGRTRGGHEMMEPRTGVEAQEEQGHWLLPRLGRRQLEPVGARDLSMGNTWAQWERGRVKALPILLHRVQGAPEGVPETTAGSVVAW